MEGDVAGRLAANCAVTIRTGALLLATACLLTGGMVSLRAQSLADVARAEEARRAQIKQPAKVYTNKDLVSVPPPTAPPPASAPADAVDTDAGKSPLPNKDEKADDAGGTPNATGDGRIDRPKDEAYWSGRMKGLVTQLDRDRILTDALQSRINALTADFSARDDPAQRRVIFLERQQTLEELDRLKKSVLSDQKAIADLQEEARRASVPPGWLR